ncbi:hypothetical protein DDI_3685 [Dickeya dianthicola RNS04.9]|nr:hypothetical protein DDI_3685 [Dickeya dianthicola RNS04.9]
MICIAFFIINLSFYFNILKYYLFHDISRQMQMARFQAVDKSVQKSMNIRRKTV